MLIHFLANVIPVAVGLAGGAIIDFLRKKVVDKGRQNYQLRILNKLYKNRSSLSDPQKLRLMTKYHSSQRHSLGRSTLFSVFKNKQDLEGAILKTNNTKKRYSRLSRAERLEQKHKNTKNLLTAKMVTGKKSGILFSLREKRLKAANSKLAASGGLIKELNSTPSTEMYPISFKYGTDRNSVSVIDYRTCYGGVGVKFAKEFAKKVEDYYKNHDLPMVYGTKLFQIKDDDGKVIFVRSPDKDVFEYGKGLLLQSASKQLAAGDLRYPLTVLECDLVSNKNGMKNQKIKTISDSTDFDNFVEEHAPSSSTTSTARKGYAAGASFSI